MATLTRKARPARRATVRKVHVIIATHRSGRTRLVRVFHRSPLDARITVDAYNDVRREKGWNAVAHRATLSIAKGGAL